MSRSFSVICFLRLYVNVYCKKWTVLLKSLLWLFTKCNGDVYDLFCNSFQIWFQHGYDEYHHIAPSWPLLENVINDSPYKKTPTISWFFINFLHLSDTYISNSLTIQAKFHEAENILLYTAKWNFWNSFGCLIENKKMST